MTQVPVVIFTPDNARILYTEVPELWKDTPQALIDPDLSEVQGVAPHFWKSEGGKVLPMTDAERAARNDYHSYTVTTNVLPTPVVRAPLPEIEATTETKKAPALEPTPHLPQDNWNRAVIWTLAAAAALAGLSWVFFK